VHDSLIAPKRINATLSFQPVFDTPGRPGTRFGLLVHHDDAVREYAYDRTSIAGKLSRGLDEGRPLGLTIVSMKTDWNRIFPFDEAQPTSQTEIQPDTELFSVAAN